jgi:aspartate aminotransferase-like enzyme
MNLIPGPTNVNEDFLKEYIKQFYSPDIEDDFFELYSKTENSFKKILCLKETDENYNDFSVCIQSGEAMGNK